MSSGRRMRTQLFFAAVRSLMITHARLRLGGYRSLRESLIRTAYADDGTFDAELVRTICLAVDHACSWYVPQPKCVQRAAATAMLLRRWGIPARVVIGVRRIPAEGHAWVEVGGVDVDNTDSRQFFHVIDVM